VLTRREWLAGLAAAPAFAAHPTYAPKVAAQVYVWTQVFDKQKKPLAQGAREIVSTSKTAGYRSLEIMTELLIPEMREALQEFEVEVPIVYAGGAYHTPDVGQKTVARILESAQDAKSFGARYINTNPDPKPGQARKTDEELATEAKYLNQLGSELNKAGMRLLVHHHNPEMMDNAREWRYLLTQLDKNNAGLCIDIDWMYQGGQQPLPLLAMAGNRVEDIHLRNASNGVWTESVNSGDYNYKAIAAHLKREGYTGYLTVELAFRPETNITRSLGENLRLSREFVERTFEVGQ
jgi:sugar phosphate isomerase/epimerase